MKKPVLCPSARCEEGANLLGIIGADGRVAYLGQPVTVDREFVQIARRGRAPEKRFRFSSGCVEGACQQWTGSRCGVVDKVLDGTDSRSVEVPDCSIRPDCRWFRQNGLEACMVCPAVITDLNVALQESEESRAGEG